MFSCFYCTFVCFSVYVCMYTNVVVHVEARICCWVCFQLFCTLFFKTVSLTESRVPWFENTGWPASPTCLLLATLLLLVSQVCGLPTWLLHRCWGSKLRFFMIIQNTFYCLSHPLYTYFLIHVVHITYSQYIACCL